MKTLLKSCYFACATIILLSSCVQKKQSIKNPLTDSSQITTQPVTVPTPNQLQGSTAQTTLKSEAQSPLSDSMPTSTQTAGTVSIATATSQIPIKTAIEKKEDKNSLDFMVENIIGKTIYVTCFVYLRKDVYTRWRWVKSNIYTIAYNQTAMIKIPSIASDSDRESTFGYLGIFDTKEEADDSTYELAPDRNKLDLDLIAKLKNKKVILQTEKYGFKKRQFKFDFIDIKKKNEKKTPSLDFLVENLTHKTINICGFYYTKIAKGTWIAAVDGKDDMAIWHYDKTPVLQLKHGDSGHVVFDKIETNRDRQNVIGFLGVFDENEKDIAEKATYELLSPQHKLPLGKLTEIANKKITLEIEQYGIQGDLIDYAIKPVKKIDWTSIVRSPKK